MGEASSSAGVRVGRVGAVLAGRVAALSAHASSAIDKHPLDGPVRVGVEGLDADEQADRRVHGGPDKAVHLYAWAHYARWREDFERAPAPAAMRAALARLAAPGAFGENLSVHGIDEAGACLGDRVRVGSVLLEVSQSRQPCWKLNLRFGVPDMARRVQQTMRSGWYCRVLEPGELQVGDAIEIVARPWPDWPLVRLMEMLYVRPLDRALLRAAQELPLVPSWQRLVARRLETGAQEDWSGRVDDPS